MPLQAEAPRGYKIRSKAAESCDSCSLIVICGIALIPVFDLDAGLSRYEGSRVRNF